MYHKLYENGSMCLLNDILVLQTGVCWYAKDTVLMIIVTFSYSHSLIHENYYSSVTMVTCMTNVGQRDTGVRKGSRSAQIPCLWHRDPLTDLIASNWCAYLACNRRGLKCDSVLRHVS